MLDIDLIGTGTITATAAGDVRLNETDDDMNVRNVFAQSGDVELQAQLSILDGVDLNDPTDPIRATIPARRQACRAPTCWATTSPCVRCWVASARPATSLISTATAAQR